MRHANVAVFVPHAGCPHQCSFCNQRAISGTQSQPDAAFVRRTSSHAVTQLGERRLDAELAFFGGSFTAIERGYMLELLGAAQEFVGEGGSLHIAVKRRGFYVGKMWGVSGNLFRAPLFFSPIII